MNILLVGPTNPYKGGVSQHTTAVAQHLSDAGHVVDLLSWSSQYPAVLYPGELELGSPDEEPLFANTRRDLAWYNPVSWLRSSKASSYDRVILALVNGFQVPAYLAITRAAHRRGKRVIALCHNVIPHDAGRLHEGVVKHFIRQVDSVVVHSSVEADSARELGARRIVSARIPFFFPLIPDPVDPDSPPSHRLLALGFVRPYKGVEVLLRAAAITDNDVEVTVAGEFWTPLSQYRDLARRLGIEEKVHLVDGYQSSQAVLELLSSHDALVVPYLSGTGSQHPRVAHFAGLPVIVTAVGDLAAQVRDGIDGFVVEPGNETQLAAAIDELYAPGRLMELRRGVQAPDEQLEWQEYLDALMGA